VEGLEPGAGFLALIAAAIAALGAYLAAARKLSGKIQTSEASDLWAESQSIREEYRAHIAELKVDLKTCIERVEAVEQQNLKLNGENGELRAKVSSLETEVERLTVENKMLRTRIAELEAGHA
jgi:predicted RNase H-like nuclease (RuvC/YqgF family)